MFLSSQGHRTRKFRTVIFGPLVDFVRYHEKTQLVHFIVTIPAMVSRTPQILMVNAGGVSVEVEHHSDDCCCDNKEA